MNLIDDVYENIIKYLNYKEILPLRRISKKWNKNINNPRIFKYYYEIDYQILFHENQKKTYRSKSQLEEITEKKNIEIDMKEEEYSLNKWIISLLYGSIGDNKIDKFLTMYHFITKDGLVIQKLLQLSQIHENESHKVIKKFMKNYIKIYYHYKEDRLIINMMKKYYFMKEMKKELVRMNELITQELEKEEIVHEKQKFDIFQKYSIKNIAEQLTIRSYLVYNKIEVYKKIQ
jgi:hypothetical protein